MKKTTLAAVVVAMMFGSIAVLCGCGTPSAEAEEPAAPTFAGPTAYFPEGEIPPEGILDNPAGVNPGDPENAVRDLKKIYAAIVAYRDKHGELPSREELKDFSKPLVEGHQLLEEDFDLPDWQYSDLGHFSIQKGVLDNRKNIYTLSYLLPRPDGTTRPAFPPQGEKDEWLHTRTYTRDNLRYLPERTTHQRRTGVWVVLWSDGTIEKVPYGKELYYPSSHNPNLKAHFFKGQAGEPPTALTAQEMFKSSNITWD